MMRRSALLFALAAIVGCKTAGQTADPFFGRTTIEPPRTGSVVGSTPQPYYPGVAASPAAPAAANVQPAIVAAPAGSSWQTPTATTSANTGGTLWSMLVGDGPRPPIPRRSGYDYSSPDRVPNAAPPAAPAVQPNYGAMAAGPAMPAQPAATNAAGAMPAKPQPWSAPLPVGSMAPTVPVSNPGLRAAPYPGATAPSLLNVQPNSQPTAVPNTLPASGNPPASSYPPGSSYPPSAAVPATPNPPIASAAPAVAQRSAPISSTLQPRPAESTVPRPIPTAMGTWTPCTPTTHPQQCVPQPAAASWGNPCYNPCTTPCQPRSAPVCLYDLPPYVGP